jgi:hypothetical protein
MPSRLQPPIAYLKANQPLTVALFLAILLSLFGANWGRVECWNLDQMAFQGTQSNGLPWGYLKPPLHTYLNHILVMKPAEAVRTLLGAEHSWQYPFQLIGARLLTLALFCGMIILLYQIASRTSGKLAAGVIALFVATSAGLIKFNHFATADAPLLFWMVASLAMALRAARSGRPTDALLAGMLAGLAAADKYNGLGVAVAIPAALVARLGWKGMFGKLSWLGSLGVALGFVLGNPGILFDTRNFVQDFLYNLYTTPVYTGQTRGAGYGDFLMAFPELIGWPATFVMAAAITGTLILALFKKLTRVEIILFAASGAVFVFYFVTIGRFPRMADRFVLPVVPFVLLMATPALGRVSWHRALPLGGILTILAYNLICSVLLDLRFLSDPRMRAQVFVRKEFAAGSTVENSYAPDWNLLPGVHSHITKLPCATGRAETFTKLFGSNEVIRKGIKKSEVSAYPPDTFTETGLTTRNPDYITFSNQVFDFTGDNDAQRFYAALDREQFGYKKVFEGSWMPRIPWTYPSHVDFLVERMVILKRLPRGQ